MGDRDLLDFSRRGDVVFIQGLDELGGNSEFFKVFQSEGISVQRQPTGKAVLVLLVLIYAK